MNPRLENTISRSAEQARGRYKTLLENARTSAAVAADRVTDGKKPVKTLSRLGLKLTAVSHRTANKVLKQQLKLIEHQMDAFAGRLSAAADAPDVASLLKTQIRLIPENAALLVRDARSTLGAVAGAGGEVRELLIGTVAELRSGRKSPATAARKKAAPRRKTAQKKTVAAAKTAQKPVPASPQAA